MSSANREKRPQAQEDQRIKKSRNGCSSCKARRVKCDETKPECRVCINRGHRCPGYRQQLRWAPRYEQRFHDDSGYGRRSSGSGASPAAGTLPEEDPKSRQGHESPAGDVTLSLSLQPSAIAQETPITSTNEPTHSVDSLLLGLVDFQSVPSFQLDGHAQRFLQELLATDLLPPDVPPSSEPGTQHSDDNDVADEAVGPQSSQDGTPPDRRLRRQSYASSSDSAPSSSTASARLGAQALMAPRSFTDSSTLLVDNWFRTVCSVWSCFDSDANLNRVLAAKTWTSSEAVSNCIKSMSAACLADQMPHLKRVAVVSIKAAITAIQRDLSLALTDKDGGLPATSFPTDLLLALFGIGTTICWVDSRQLGVEFIREARAVLSVMDRKARRLTAEDREILAFFNHGLIYWDMLLAVVADGDDEDGTRRTRTEQLPKVEGRKHRQHQQRRQGSGVSTRAALIVPHPWTGISTATSGLFARVIRLCRRFRRRIRQAHTLSIAQTLQASLDDIATAKALESELLALEVVGPDEAEDLADTGDRLTPPPHLAHVAEGYRLASLLQLHLTFPDLTAGSGGMSANCDATTPEEGRGQWCEQGGEGVRWDESILPLCLRLVRTLANIPPNSGSRCIQPLLYISAAAGLRFDVDTASATAALGNGSRLGGMPRGFAEPRDNSAISVDAPVQWGLDTATTLLLPDDHSIGRPCLSEELTGASIAVAHARRFVLQRLSMMEHSLPSRPIVVAQDLVKAVWRSYDAERPGACHVHWIDVMEESNIRTIFG